MTNVRPWDDGLRYAWWRRGAKRGCTASAGTCVVIDGGHVYRALVGSGRWRVWKRPPLDSKKLKIQDDELVAEGIYRGVLRVGCVHAEDAILANAKGE